jgi:hypothetical protein
MRKISFVAATLFVAGVAGTAPGAAAQYGWCAKTPMNGGNPECNFSTYQQCQASISGVGGSCIRNPASAYRAQPTGDWNRSNWNNGGYSSGLNNSGSGWDHNNWHSGWDSRGW